MTYKSAPTAVLAICLSIPLFLFSHQAFAQEEQQTETPPTVVSAGENEKESPVASNEEEKSIFTTVNGYFETAVDHMAAVLFYRVFAEDEKYIVFETEEAAKKPLNGEYIWNEETELYHLKEKRGLLNEKMTFTKELAQQAAENGYLKSKGEGDEATYFPERPTGGAPVVVLWLACGSLFFTIYMGFFNFWGFRHAVEIVTGKYDNPEAHGEVTHFQALSSALSATVGLGNIAGVTIAMTLGGPGAFLWMILCGLFGMCSKFVECTLGQKYRLVKPDGTVLGGPMRYLDAGLTEIGLRPLGLILSFVFAVMCILASFGGGNMFQANQSGTVLLAELQKEDKQELQDLSKLVAAAKETGNPELLAPLEKQHADLNEKINSFDITFRSVYGLLLAFFVGLVIIGGIRRIGAAAEKIVPTMCAIYIVVCLYIIGSHIGEVPALITLIFTEAFNPEAMGGGLIGVLVVGVQRAAFSNEAGVGSAAIAHSAAKTSEPIREGAVALLGPFIDTIIICSMTALVILITGAWDNTQWIEQEGLKGAALTSRAFGEEVSIFPWVLSIAVILFAYSTIISWSYYGERCWEQLFGSRSTMIYKFLTICFVFLGAIFNLGAVLDFSDMMILSMAFPNVLGAILLAPKVKRDLSDYWRRYKAGEFKKYK